MAESRTQQDASEDPWVVASRTAVLHVGDQPLNVVKGETRLRSGHPLVKAHPDAFRREKG